MIVEITKRNGTTLVFTADYVFYQVDEGEEGKEDWVQVIGHASNHNVDDSYLVKTLLKVRIFDYGRLLWTKHFS